MDSAGARLRDILSRAGIPAGIQCSAPSDKGRLRGGRNHRHAAWPRWKCVHARFRSCHSVWRRARRFLQPQVDDRPWLASILCWHFHLRACDRRWASSPGVWYSERGRAGIAASFQLFAYRAVPCRDAGYCVFNLPDSVLCRNRRVQLRVGLALWPWRGRLAQGVFPLRRDFGGLGHCPCAVHARHAASEGNG